MMDIKRKTITVLGSTGSVGRQTMDVARLHGMPVYGISGYRNTALLEQQIRRFSPAVCAVVEESAAKDLRVRVADTDTVILSGVDSLCELASAPGAGTVCNSVTGVAGLAPTVAAVESRHDVALANKETLVTAGDTVLARAKASGVSVLPVDSEHSAIFQCLQGNREKDISRIFLTASGGAFYGMKRQQLSGVTPKMALRHPTWKMGSKITVDCASLANKGLEVIEAARLFGVSADQIEVVIHRESIVHSMVEFADHAVMAQMSLPDMRLCIQYALTYPERLPSLDPKMDPFALPALTFARPDTETFLLLDTAYYALRRGGLTPAVFNGANEAAVAFFMKGKISFPRLFDIVDSVTRSYRGHRNAVPDVKSVMEADAYARAMVLQAIK